MPSATKYSDEFDDLGHSMSWPTDFIARLLVTPKQLTPEQLAKITDGNNRSPPKNGQSPPAPGSSGGAVPLIPSHARIVHQELSNAVWGSFLTFIALFVFQVGFTNKLAIGLWSAAVFLSFAVSLLATRLKGGATLPLLVWHYVIMFGFQLTLLLGTFKCLSLELTGSRSFSVVALSMGTMMFSTENVGHNGQTNSKFMKKWGWTIVTGITQLAFFVVMGVVDAVGDCNFSTDDMNLSSLPNTAVVQLFQQIVPIAMLVGTAARAYHFTVQELEQRIISEDFAIKCLRAAVQRDVLGLVMATEDYDQNPPAIPSMRDDALHMVIMFLHTIASQPTLVAPMTPRRHSSVSDNAVQPMGRTTSDLGASGHRAHGGGGGGAAAAPLQKLKVSHLSAFHNNGNNSPMLSDTDSAFPQPHENQPDKFSNAASDVRRQRANRLGSIHGNLGVGGLSANNPHSLGLETPNSATPTRPSSGPSLMPVGIASVKAYCVLFALPKLSSYMMSSQKSMSMAEMFLGEFAEVVHEVLHKWDGVFVTSGFNFVVGRFTNLAHACAASVDAQAKMQANAGHHKDVTLNMLGGHKLLTFTVVGEILYGRPSSATSWSFGYSAVERIFDSAIQAFGTREPLPANIIATNLTGDLTSAFDFLPSPIHTTLMTVQKAIKTGEGGTPVLSKELVEECEDHDIELLDLPMVEAAIPKYRPTHTTNEGGRGGLSKTKSLAHRPPSGRTQSVQGSKPRKGLPPQVIEVWNSIDIDGNGFLDLMELEALIKKIGLPMNKLEIRDFFKKIDVDGSGSLSIEEFEDAYYSTALGGANVIGSIRRAAMAMAHSNEKEFISLVEKSWRKYDTDGSGKLDQVEVGRILRDLGMNHTPEEIKWMFDRMDRDKSGFVEFEEFMSLFSADASEFLAVRERIQAVGRVMNKTDLIFSTPDQAMRDHRVKIKDTVNRWFGPFVFVYIFYTFCSTSYYITLGPDLAPVTLLQSIINIAIDCVYAAWCILKFLYLPKESRGSVTFKHIWKHHIRTVECWVDLITIIPADLLYFILGNDLNGGLISYYRANKILCIYHLDERYSLLMEKVNPALTRAANALMFFFVVCHVLCCALIAITRVLGDDTTEPLLGINGILADDSMVYLAPLYWAILTLSGQLSGASVPELDTHLYLLQLAVFVGLPLYTVVLGTVGNAATVEDSYSRYLDKIDMLRSFFEYTRLSKDFENDILAYYKHLYTTTGSLDITENPLEDLPTELSIPVVIAMGSDMLKAVPIFKEASSNMEFVHELTIKLVPKVIEPLAVVMRKGEIGAEMYFVTFGNFNIVIDTGKIVFTLGRGNFFGEIALLHSGKRTATIVNSHRFGNVLMLVKDQFQEVARFFPDCLSQVYKAAEDRIKQTKESEQKEKEAAEKAAREAREREKELQEAKLKAEREAAEADELAGIREDNEDSSTATTDKLLSGGEVPTTIIGANGNGVLQPLPTITGVSGAGRNTRIKSIGAEADATPRNGGGGLNTSSPNNNNNTNHSSNSNSFAKPASPNPNDPVTTNIASGMEMSEAQLNLQLQSIGFAMRSKMDAGGLDSSRTGGGSGRNNNDSGDAYTSVNVVADTSFDDEATRPSQRRPGAANGARARPPIRPGDESARGPSVDDGSSTTKDNQTTCSDFDDDDDEESVTDGSTRSHSTIMNSDSGLGAGGGGRTIVGVTMPQTANAAAADARPSPPRPPVRPGAAGAARLPDVPSQL